MNIRFKQAIEKAKDAFWASIAENYPEITKGDLDPISENNFDKSVKEVVSEWLHFNQRLFYGVFPTGLVWCDRYHEKNGDYKRLAYLNFKTLVLDIEKDCPEELLTRITLDAKELQDRKGEEYQVSSSGQTITLGQ